MSRTEDTRRIVTSMLAIAAMLMCAPRVWAGGEEDGPAGSESLEQLVPSRVLDEIHGRLKQAAQQRPKAQEISAAIHHFVVARRQMSDPDSDIKSAEARLQRAKDTVSDLQKQYEALRRQPRRGCCHCCLLSNLRCELCCARRDVPRREKALEHLKFLQCESQGLLVDYAKHFEPHLDGKPDAAKTLEVVRALKPRFEQYAEDCEPPARMRTP